MIKYFWEKKGFFQMGNYYDGTKLLSLKDINGNTPEIFMVTSNRTGGKTTYFSRLVMNKFLKGQGKFCLIYRFNYEIDNVADKFFKDINTLFFPNYYMKSERRAKGIYHELFLYDRQHGDDSIPSACGYAIALNNADSIKRYSHLFSDVQRMLFDEFQSETNHYCPDEVNKFISVHNSIARGQGEMSRYVPVYMCSNPVSIINPYYVALGISSRLTKEVKFLRGDGFVLEQGYVEAAANAQRSSGFNKAFNGNKYLDYATQGVYLNDNLAFIERPHGKSNYIATVRYEDVNYAIREYPEQGVIYCDTSTDSTYPVKLAITTEDHNVNYVMLKNNDMFVSRMRFFFEHGSFRFKDLKCKECIMSMLSY